MPDAKRKVDAGQGFRNEFGEGRVTSKVNAKRKSVSMCTVLRPICGGEQGFQGLKELDKVNRPA